MPNTASAKKALRQNKRKRALNVQRKKHLKQVLKDYKRLIAAGDTQEAKARLSLVYKALDKAAKVGLIKKNKAARLKSRHAMKLHNLSASPLSDSPLSQAESQSQ